MGRFDKVALATATGATLLCLIGMQSFAYHYYLDQIPSGGLASATAGWVIATYGPIAVAALFWRYGKRAKSRMSLVIHLCFFPSALALFVLGNRLMLSVIQDPDFDAMMGGPHVPAFLSLVVAVVSYLVALIDVRMRDPATTVNGS